MRYKVEYCKVVHLENYWQVTGPEGYPYAYFLHQTDADLYAEGEEMADHLIDLQGLRKPLY